MDGYKDELKPQFNSSSVQFLTIIYASVDVTNVGDDVGDDVGDVSEIKLTERQQKIVNLIIQQPSVTAKHMSETLSVSSRTVERELSTLKDKGVLMREGKDNDGVWLVVLKQ